MKIPYVAAAVAMLCLLGGCSRGEAPESAAKQPIAPPSKQGPVAPVAAPPPPASAANPAVGDSPGVPEPSVAELNRALELWIFQRNAPPKDLNELVTTGYLKRLPTPPTGKRFTYDSRSMSVRAVDK